MFMRMIYDEKLAQAAYLIGCQKTGEAVVIDPERDVDRYIALARQNGLHIVATAETHIHADFVSGSRELAEHLGAKVYVSDEGDADWKYQWLDKKIGGGSYDYQLIRDSESFFVGNIELTARHTPGHTPEHLVFLVTDRGGGADKPMGMVSGDFLFVGDVGRPDLLESAAGQAGAMKPAAQRLYQSVKQLGDVADFIQVWPAHGAGSACGKSLGAVLTSTVGYEKRFNPAIRAAESEAHFVDYILEGQPEPPLYFANMKRDNKLGPPVLGKLPAPPRLSFEQLSALDAMTVAILDTRSWEQFRDGHVPGSLSLAFNKTFNTDAGSLVRDTEDVYLVIDAQHVDEAVRDLVRVGLDHIKGWCPPSEVTSADPVRLATIDEVEVDQAVALVETGQARVLDVRRATEFAQDHLPGATNIAHTRLVARLSDVPRGGKLLVHCQAGARSARASSYLQRAGLDVVNLKGGINAWHDAGALTSH